MAISAGPLFTFNPSVSFHVKLKTKEEFGAMDSAGDHAFTFNEAISFVVPCETQAEIEAFAEALAAGLARFVRFLGASKLDAAAIGEPLLRRRACSSQGAKASEG
jgi:predicted 3-demethylubiquinone-9 3-methyltransferase (glyoxalase superfamily)